MPLIAVIMLPVLITELDLVGFDEPYHSDLPPGISSPTSTAVLQLEEVIHTIKKLGIVKKGPHSSNREARVYPAWSARFRQTGTAHTRGAGVG